MLYIVIVVGVATTIPEKNPLFVGVVNAIGVIEAARWHQTPNICPPGYFQSLQYWQQRPPGRWDQRRYSRRKKYLAKTDKIQCV